MLKRNVRLEPTVTASADTEAALYVATVYQDSLTQHWATRLWDQVGQLIGGGDICHKAWRIGDLAHTGVYADAVNAAAKADVVVVSVRDTAVLPLNLYTWVDGWLPRRAGSAGALVALIGVPAQPDAQCGQTHQFLEAVARSAGLDFLPREHKVPEEWPTPPDRTRTAPLSNTALALAGGARGRRSAAGVRWSLGE